MSLTATMQSWCHNFKTKKNDRSVSVSRLTKHAHHVVKSHNAFRNKMSKEIREKLKVSYSTNKKRVLAILTDYIKDRAGAIEALAAMRSRQAHHCHEE